MSSDSIETFESPPVTIYRARWVCPVEAPIIPNGAVAVKDSKIVAVGIAGQVIASLPNASRVVELGDGAIIPGLVNAHTHLEFSDLDQPIGEPGIEFTQWIRQVVARRNELLQQDDSSRCDLIPTKAEAIRRGLIESGESGTWALGEIATSPFAAEQYISAEDSQAQHPSLVIFLEQLGRGDVTCQAKRIELQDFLTCSNRNLKVVAGASPHAPYSVGPDLLSQIVSQAASSRCPVAMHLAETRAEREFVENRSGPFVELLKDFGIWDPTAFANQWSIIETLKLLSQAPSALVVHGNYLTDVELDFIANQRERMSIAFCPRTHRYFGHDEYPLEKMLSRNINVCVGTDSRASNPDLNLLRELQLISNSFPDLDPETVLALGTIKGAKALGLEATHGTISVGKSAALSFVQHPDAKTSRSPFEWLFEQQSTCVPIL